MKKIFVIFGIMMFILSGIVLADGNDDEDDLIPFLDVVFVIDSTGSMHDEIREVKMHIENIIEEIQMGTPKPNVTIGFVIYRDYPDQEPDYLYEKLPLTSDIQEALDFLEKIDARNGGNYKEAVSIGLDVAISEMNWRELDTSQKIIYDEFQNPVKITSNNAKIQRIITLIGDAPPRTEYIDEELNEKITIMSYKENIEDAISFDIVINTISGSGMDENGVDIWTELAEETGGTYEPLVYEYRDVQEYVEEERIDHKWAEKIESSPDYCSGSDGVGGCFQTNNFKSCASRQIQIQAESMGVKYVDEPVFSDIEENLLDDAINDESDLHELVKLCLKIGIRLILI